MQSRQSKANEWNLRSIVLAAAVSVGMLLVIMQLAEQGHWPDDFGWINVTLPALFGSIMLGLRHRGTWLLSLFLFGPLMAFVLLILGMSIGVGRGNDL